MLCTSQVDSANGTGQPYSACGAELQSGACGAGWVTGVCSVYGTGPLYGTHGTGLPSSAPSIGGAGQVHLMNGTARSSGTVGPLYNKGVLLGAGRVFLNTRSFVIGVGGTEESIGLSYR